MTSWIRGLRGRPVVLALGATAAITLLVRTVGLGSQAVVTSRFGAGRALDGFFIALIVPGLLVTPLAAAVEVSVSAAYARLVATNPLGAPEFRRRVMLYSIGVGAALSVAAVAALPLLVFVSSPGASAVTHAAARRAAVFVYPSILPQLVAATGGALLFGHGRYQAPTAATVVNPALIIAALLAFHGSDIRVLGGAVLAGYVLEAAIVLVLVRWRRVVGSSSAAAEEELTVAKRDLRPVLLGYALLRVVPVVDQGFASALGPGSLTRFAIAWRLFEVGIGLLIIPNIRMATTRLAGLRKDDPSARLILWTELRRSALVGAVSAVVVAVGGPILLFVVYRHGQFTTDDAWETTKIALVLCGSFAPFAVGFLLPRVLAMLGGGSAMVRVSWVEVLCNITLNIVLVKLLGVVGIALSSLVSYSVVAWLEWRIVRRILRGAVRQ